MDRAALAYALSNIHNCLCPRVPTPRGITMNPLIPYIDYSSLPNNNRTISMHNCKSKKALNYLS